MKSQVGEGSGNPFQDRFYRDVLDEIEATRLPFLVGGAYALRHYAGIHRDTKDLDLFVHERDAQAMVDRLARAGFQARMVAPHWLAKVESGDLLVDLIFSAQNGIARVDEVWFERAEEGTLLGWPVRVIPPEEMIWSKSFVMARERYDGADIAHILHSRADTLDWRRLIDRYGDEHWPVLLSHLVLFGWIFPSERARVPGWVEAELIGRLCAGRPEDCPPVCRGTLLSTDAYRRDVRNGYRDARLAPFGKLRPEDLLR